MMVCNPFLSPSGREVSRKKNYFHFTKMYPKVFAWCCPTITFPLDVIILDPKPMKELGELHGNLLLPIIPILILRTEPGFPVTRLTPSGVQTSSNDDPLSRFFHEVFPSLVSKYLPLAKRERREFTFSWICSQFVSFPFFIPTQIFLAFISQNMGDFISLSSRIAMFAG